MGVVLSAICWQRPIENGRNLSDRKYKRFQTKRSRQACQVITQLTGDGLLGGSSPFHVNEHVSVRYHYQYQCTFAPNDDSKIVYGM